MWDVTQLFSKSVEQLDEANYAIKILKENPNIDGTALLAKLEKKLWKKPTYLNSLSSITNTNLNLISEDIPLPHLEHQDIITSNRDYKSRKNTTPTRDSNLEQQPKIIRKCF